MAKNKAKNPAQEPKVNFMELISEARVQRIVAEEQEVESNNDEVKQLKARTNYHLEKMAELQAKADESINPGEVQELLAARRELRNEVVVDNIRLVTVVLQKYGYYNADKFQNGCIGLLKAAETFNAEKGVPFGNYAAFCIETEVRLAFKRVNRAFESKQKGFLESLDAPATRGGDGDKVAEKHEEISDPYAEIEFDSILEEAEIDTLFYDVIIPVIETYGKRSKDMDMDLWQQLEIRYFIELSMEQSQRQRITLSEMAKQLGTTTQNLRTRHKKVMELLRQACIAYGYRFHKSKTGRVRFSREEPNTKVKYRGQKHK